jgi:hypothetical protein
MLDGAGRVAFIRTPDGISIELVQASEAVPPAEPWGSMANTNSWWTVAPGAIVGNKRLGEALAVARELQVSYPLTVGGAIHDARGRQTIWRHRVWR